jgi:hypothetical protein
MPQGLIQPANEIVYAGTPTYLEYEVKTIAEMIPGRLVMHDTNEWDIKVCTSGATTALGVLDVEPGELRTSNYDAGDQARVITGDCVVLMTKDSGAAVAIGDKLIPADSGMVQGATTAGAVIGYALQAVAKETKAELLVKLQI